VEPLPRVEAIKQGFSVGAKRKAAGNPSILTPALTLGYKIARETNSRFRLFSP
jgi:hypothetical protein